MASSIMYSVNVDKGVKKWGVDWSKSLAFLCKPEFMGELAKGYRYYINKKVPKLHGYLRRSAHAVYKVKNGGEGGNGTGSATIYWGDRNRSKKYAHYQFVGDVYGPNKAVFNGKGEHVGWRSPTGFKGDKNGVGAKHKTKMGWKMGNPGSYATKDGKIVYIKGYTTPGTKYNWIKEFADDKSDIGKSAVSIRAGRYMYEAFCIKAGIKPHGGAHVYHSWNQIKNRLT